MPVCVFSFETMHKHGDILPQMLTLRHQEFKKRQDYDVPVFKDMEYDQFDTPAAVYVVYLDDGGVARGCSRMSPTSKPYMIETIWPHILTAIPLPHSDAIWESSRFCVDSTLPSDQRQKVKLAILQAKIEYCLAVGMEGLIGVMPPLIWRAVFANSGWPIKHLGSVLTLDTGEKIVPGWIPVHQDILFALESRGEGKGSLFASIKGIQTVIERTPQQLQNSLERYG